MRCRGRRSLAKLLVSPIANCTITPRWIFNEITLPPYEG
jgi:hypothetical protein